MALKFQKLTRTNIRKLISGDKLHEHGISFERLPNGDGVSGNVKLYQKWQ